MEESSRSRVLPSIEFSKWRCVEVGDQDHRIGGCLQLLWIRSHSQRSYSFIQDLLQLGKVLVYTEYFPLQKALLRLITCVDGACTLQWFSDQDTASLLSLAEKLFSNYSATTHIRFSRSVPSSVEEVMSRFYPRMKMGEMLISLELKPGLRRYAAHFHIIRGMVDPKQDKIWLFVAQIDNIDTSSCIITPPEVNFLLNGKEVVGRNPGPLDKDPQLPTNVTHVMKYGVNMLQVVGEFPGQFLVIIAIMHTVPCSDAQELQNYVSPTGSNNSESAIVETPSIISLNCPISQSRIKTPVKGQLCEHPQCFDYDNFLEINSKRPSWQCPYCKKAVCYLDLRIDRTFLKVLMEAEEKFVDVILSSNGSWEKIKDHSAGRDAILHDHNKNVSAVGNSIPNKTNSFDLNVSVDSYMDLLMTDIAIPPAFDMPADDRKPETTSPEENKLSPSRNSKRSASSMILLKDGHHLGKTGTKGRQELPAFDLNAYPVSDIDDSSSVQQQPPQWI